MSAGLIRRTIKHRRSRRKNNPAKQAQECTPIYITAVVAAGPTATITFNQPVLLNGVPAYTTNIAGTTAVSAAQSSPNVVAVTFSAPVLAMTRLNIPFCDPAIRNASGGFVTGNVATV